MKSFSLFLQLQLIVLVVDALTSTRGKWSTRTCDYDLKLIWSRELGHTPFAAAPVITDVDADGQLDIIAAAFSEEVTVVRGRDGADLSGTKWPYQLVDASVHASPIQYDVTGDGMLDIMVLTSDGELLFFSPDGILLHNKTSKLSQLQVDKDWQRKIIGAEKGSIHDYILDDLLTEGQQVSDGYVGVDPHVLATPVLVDLNQDDMVEELVIPVNYYFDLEDYSHSDNVEKQQNLSLFELEKYLVSGLVILNLTSMSVLRTIHLELTTVMSEYPGYILYSPTIIDLDSNGGEPEIVIGTSAGRIHVLDSQGQNRANFPLSTHTIHGQVTVADVNLDGRLEIIAMDTKANVLCWTRDGQVVWETQISGTTTAGSRVADIDQDGKMEVIIATDDGMIWVLKGVDGDVLKGWPLRVAKSLTAVALLTQASDYPTVDLVVLGDDENLHILSGDQQCRRSISLGDTSLVTLLSHDLVPEIPGMEILVAAKDGTLLCLGRVNMTDTGEIDHVKTAVLNGWHSETKQQNGFTYSNGKEGLVLQREGSILDITGVWSTVYFEIIDNMPPKRHTPYHVNVHFGNQLLARATYNAPGSYSLGIPCPTLPTQGHLKVTMRNHNGQIFYDSTAVRFNMTFLHDLKWLLLCPFVAMGVILLLLHGYPAADLLPLTQQAKVR